MRGWWMTMAMVLVVACKGGDTDVPTATPPPPPTDTDVDTDVVTTADTAPPVDTDPQVPVVDCSVPPSGPFSGRQLVTPRAYHGLAFDRLGNLVGSDGNNLLISTDTNTTQIFVPNAGSAQQMAYLPNGDLAVAFNSGTIETIAPNGVRTTLASGISAYGLEIGPDGYIYTANQSQVHRIDPTGVIAPTVVIPTSAVPTPKVITFDRTGSQMFVGTNFSDGRVWRFDMGSDGDPILPGTLIGTTGGSWHDGLGMDACGRLYVAEYNTRSLYMLEPGSGSTQLLDYYDTPLGGSAYGHGLVWGSGVGAWSDHDLYVPLPYNGNRVAEIDLGVPHKDFNGGNYTTIP